jgi:hypothetical protein
MGGEFVGEATHTTKRETSGGEGRKKGKGGRPSGSGIEFFLSSLRGFLSGYPLLLSSLLSWGTKTTNENDKNVLRDWSENGILS